MEYVEPVPELFRVLIPLSMEPEKAFLSSKHIALLVLLKFNCSKSLLKALGLLKFPRVFFVLRMALLAPKPTPLSLSNSSNCLFT